MLLKIYDLKLNRQINPIGIDRKELQFSFKVTGGTSFLVNIYEGYEHRKIFSKKIALSKIGCFYLSYPFKTGQRYYWDVTCNGITSELASFETALPLDSDFITVNETIVCPILWKEFDLGKIVQARLYITGLGLYRAFINGTRIGDNYLTPLFNDYDAYLRYQTYDITSLLDHHNKIEVFLGDGWYKGRFGAGQTIYGDTYLLCAKLVAELEDGSRCVIQTDETWKASDSVILDASIYNGETRDDSKNPSVRTSCIKQEVTYRLVPDTTVPVINKMEIHPSIFVSPKGEQILDFGQNMVGFCKFICREERGRQIHLQYGEVLQQECFYNGNYRSAKAEYNYTSDGCIKEVEPFFTFYGFRYVKVSGISKIDPKDFTGVVLYSDLQQTLQVSTDHVKLNRLMQNSLWGQRGNFIDIPTDCPQRDERLGWTADAQVFVNTACYHMDCYSFYKKYLNDLRYDQKVHYEGDIPMYSPSLKKAAGSGGAVWADAGTIIPWNLYQAYGDKRLLDENYSMMKEYTDTVITVDKKDGNHHIITSGFTYGDWLAQDGVCPQALLGGTDENFIKSIYYKNSLDLTAKAAKVLRKKEDERYYSSLSNQVRKAILREYFTPVGKLAVDTQTAYVLSLYYQVFIDKNKVIEGLKARLKKDLYRIKSGFTGTPLMLPVLFENGMDEEAYRILFNEEFPGWLYAVNLGATTIWERWNSMLPDGRVNGINMNSFNHYAYGSVCEAIYKYIAGLKFTKAGCKCALIAPKLNYRLKHMKLAFESPLGTYQIEWFIQEDGVFQMDVMIPYGATAKVILPNHKDKRIDELTSGEYHYCYMPVIDYHHPFSESSIVLDLLSNKEANRVFRERLPRIYAMVTGEDEEFLAMNLIAFGYHKMFGTSLDEIAEAGKALRVIKV